MELDALKTTDRRMARLIVSNALAALLASESPAAASSQINLNEPERAVLYELATRAKVNLTKLDMPALTDLNPQARTKLLETANSALMTLSVGELKPHDADEKLGSLGILSPARFEAKTSDSLKMTVEKARLKVKDAVNVIKKPDAYQHLFAPADFGEEKEQLSIFVGLLNKLRLIQRNETPDWLMVIGRRKGAKIEMSVAFRIFGDEIPNYANYATLGPVELLKAFVERHGVELIVSDFPVGKFCLYKIIQGDDIRVSSGNQVPTITNFFFRKNSQTGKMEIALAFAIGISSYEGSISSHIARGG